MRPGSSGVGEFRTRLSLSAWLEKGLYRCGSAKRYRVLKTRQMSRRVERHWCGIQEFCGSSQGTCGSCIKGNVATWYSI
jgi:hypothetical protein